MNPPAEARSRVSMTSWQADSPSAHPWSELGRFGHGPPTSLAEVLEGSHAREGDRRRNGNPLSWADLLKAPGSGTPSNSLAQSPTQPTAPQPEPLDDPLLAEAAKSKPDLTGKIRCLGCGRVATSHKGLAQHLKDKHQGMNSPNAPGSTNPQTGAQNSRPPTLFSLGDVLAAAKAPKRGPGSKPAASLRLTHRQMRNMRGLVKAYPTKSELAKAIRGQLGTAAGSKKLSRLKRVILRERSDKAAAAAAAALEAANVTAEQTQAARAQVLTSFKEAEAELEAEKKSGRMPLPANITKVQVLEMALAEAGRRVEEAQRKAKAAETAATKAAEERARVWKESLGGEPEEREPGSSAALAARSLSPSAEGQSSQAETAALGEKQKENAAARGREAGADVHESAAAGSNAVPLPLLPDEELVDGLQGFENVLASWLHDAHDQAGGSWLDTPDDDSPETAPSEADPAVADADVESLEGSEGMGPEGWDDVLAAWMSNAGVLNNPPESLDEIPQQEQTPIASPARSAASAKFPTAGPSTGGDMESVGLATPSRVDPILFRRPAGFDAVISPSNAGSAADDSAHRGTPAHRAQLGRQESLGGSWQQEQGGAAPLPLLADVLAGGQLSHDALLDLRVSLSESLDMKSEEERQAGGVFAARASGGGAVALPELRSLGSWGQWPPSNEESSSRWIGEGRQQKVPPLPQDSLQEKMNPFAARSAIDRAAAAANRPNPKPQGPPVDLFGQTSSINSMADLGLPRLQSADSHVHGSKLYHNVLTASQQKLLEGLPAPRNRQAPGEPPLARLPSITGSAPPPRATTALADSSPGPSPAWMQSGSGDDSLAEQGSLASKRSVSLPAGQSRSGFMGRQGPGRTGSHMPQQHFFGHSVRQPGPLDGSQWPMNHTPEFDPAMFQGFPYGGHGGYQEMDSYHHQPLLPSHISMPDFMPGGMGMGMGGSMGQRRLSADAAAMGLPGGRPGVPGMHFPGAPVDHFGMYAMPDGFGHPVPMPGHMMPGQLPGHDPDAFQSFLSGGSLSSGGGGNRGGKPPAAHEFHCEVCRVTCCGLANFQQHCSSKRHLRKAAAAGALAIPDLARGAGGKSGDDSETQQASNPTYVGLQAQCRNYCKQIITTDLNKVVVELLQSLLFWQERSKAMNAHNAARKKRLVSGLREVAKAIKLKKARTVIVTPNIEQIETEGGLDDLLTSILQQAEESETPVVFALSRKKLGQVFGCRKKMSAIAVLDYSGAEALYKQMETLAEQGREEWRLHQEAIKNGTATDLPEAAKEDTADGDSGSEAEGDALDAPTACEAAAAESSPLTAPPKPSAPTTQIG